jgi:aspartate/methionine/tyrosine aminotransferase
MSEILLAKPKLPEGWIDVSVGEPHVVREALLQTFDLDLTHHPIPTVERMHEYPLPTGYKPLVEMLEACHGSPVIITNGAKQALGATFYALNRMGLKKVSMRNPYWALIPPLLHMHGLEHVARGGDSILCLAPNNPDGFMKGLEADADFCHLADMPFIHDAAYYTHVYLPPSQQLKQYGDVQIYSISKMLGLSGLRLGYAVCPNPEFYRYIQEYMEAMTVGVSALPQIFLEQLFKAMEIHPDLTKQFETKARNSLISAKKIMQEIDPEVLEIPDNLPEVPGMFLWAKVGPKCDFAKARVNAIDGALFGVPGYVRMNLAFDTKTMSDIVGRLNSAKVK